MRLKDVSQAAVVDSVQAENNPLPSLHLDKASAFALFMEETDENYCKLLHVTTEWTHQLFKTDVGSFLAAVSIAKINM